MDAFLMFMVPIFFFSLMFFVFGLGVIGTTQNQIQTEIDALNCPLPRIQGSQYPFPNPTQSTNATYNTRSASNQTLTLTCTPVHTFKGYDYHFGEPGLALGIFFFPFDYISELVHKLGAVVTLMFIVITPPSGLDNFAIGTVLVTNILFFIYLSMYIMLGVGVYKMINPLGGS